MPCPISCFSNLTRQFSNFFLPCLLSHSSWCLPKFNSLNTFLIKKIPSSQLRKSLTCLSFIKSHSLDHLSYTYSLSIYCSGEFNFLYCRILNPIYGGGKKQHHKHEANFSSLEQSHGVTAQVLCK